MKAQQLMFARSAPLIEFKKKLSLRLGEPIMVLGEIDPTRLIEEHQQQTDVIKKFPAKSRGFADMSEVWITGDFDPPSGYTEARALFPAVRSAVSTKLGKPVRVLKAVLDTIDSNSCIIPHSDNFFQHGIALRVHIPLTTSPGSIGISFHPDTLEPHMWRMDIGKIYAFNNFEPHTVIKTDEGERAHLICDVVVMDIFTDFRPSDGKAIKTALTMQSCEEALLTHTLGNMELRNRLARKYGYSDLQAFSLAQQMTRKYIKDTYAWLQELAKRA